MRFAYADPPYLSCGARYYGHPEWDDQACHLMLVGKLTVDYPDGWALSCRAVDLRWLLPACPEDVHVASWTKPFAGSARRNVRIYRVWEPVIFRTLRRNTTVGERVRDALVCNPTRQLGLIGAKPPAFNRWILDLLGFVDDDTLDDLFPGTGGMALAINSPLLTEVEAE